jgi:hypothetical protein
LRRRLECGLVQAHSGEAEQHEEQPHDRAEHLVALAQSDDLRLKLDRILGHHVQRHDRAWPAAQPARHGRPGHVHPFEQMRVALFASQLAQSVIVRSSAAGHGFIHRRILAGRKSRSSTGSSLISRVLQLRAPNSTMS